MSALIGISSQLESLHVTIHSAGDELRKALLAAAMPSKFARKRPAVASLILSGNGPSSVILCPFGLQKDLSVTRGFHWAHYRDSIRSGSRTPGLKTCYAIIKISTGSSETNVTLVTDETGKTPLSFSRYEEARQWIRLMARRKKYFETGRFAHTVVKVGSTLFVHAYKRTIHS